MPLQQWLDYLESALQSAPRGMKERIAIYNRLVDMAARYLELPHPAARPQLIPVEKVKGNDYNPNKVAPPEMRLLRLSMAKDGQTMPVVVAVDRKGLFQVVDGFHRRNVAKNAPEVRDSLKGYLFVVELNKSLEDRITSTVRHNAARGSHKVELTAKLVTTLKKHNWSNERIGMELGMDPDEVLRLKQVTGLAEAFKDEEFSKAWE
ncbi:IbrB-like domain-containing protein [Nitratidesulfovibrio sp. 1201_IL3209]|uniref:IbrB-like domain-containing protein n=1 Tax=Nitratidesulfovibrio sp. 1201_IL3209 TaxID=3084053 RepID=UPI002FD9302B